MFLTINEGLEMNLLEATKRKFELQEELLEFLKNSKEKEHALRKEIESCMNVLNACGSGLDIGKIDTAKKILVVRGLYENGGEDRGSVINDAIKQLSTGIPIRETYSDLWVTFFGTKNYAHWSGQRSDHEYGYGPKHGSIVFAVGINEEIRNKKLHADLSEYEIECCIYYLLNISEIQKAEFRAKEQSAA